MQAMQITFENDLVQPARRNSDMTKKVAMMQPYLFPYLGYFQLISAVDVFVLGDNLQYVKESWINRNRILMNGRDRLITFPLRKGHHVAKINERFLSNEFEQESKRIVRVVQNAYLKAPCYAQVMPLVEELILHPEMNLSKYAEHSIRKICDFLDIRTPILVASDLAIDDVADKQDRVIKTVKKLGGDTYINFIGGLQLYDFDVFRKHRLTLKFHKISDINYRQFGDTFVPLLSIIDVLMFNSVDEIRKRLNCFSLLDDSQIAKSPCDECSYQCEESEMALTQK
jgi:hypothetical protein